MHRAGRVGEAVAVYQKILEEEPFYADAHYLLGVAAWNAGHHEGAAAFWAQAVSVEPRNPLFLAWKAKAKAKSSVDEGPEIKPISQFAERLEKAGASGGKRAEEFKSYQYQVERMRRTPYLDYPSHVHLETFAKCNARCTFCPYPVMERQGERMPMELIEKIIGDLQEIPKELPLQLSVQKVNEPFLDKRLFDILALIGTRLPQAGITLTSNGSALTDAVLKRLSDAKNIRYLWVSFNDHRKDEYERAMGLPFERTIERLEALHQHHQKTPVAARVVVSRVGDGTQDDKEFSAWVAQRFPAFEVSVTQRGNWIGQVETDVPDIPDLGCMRWYEISIAATGSVSHCCMDGLAQFPIGDVRERSVLEIYNGADYRRLREEAFSRQGIQPCGQCTFL